MSNSTLANNQHWIVNGWIKTIEQTIQQSLEILIKRQVLRKSVVPTNFLILPVHFSIIHSDNQEISQIKSKDHHTIISEGSILSAYVLEEFDTKKNILNLKLSLTRCMSYRYLPKNIIAAIENIFFDADDLKLESKRTKSKKGRRGHNHYEKRQTLIEAIEHWSQSFESWQININNKFEKESKKNPDGLRATTNINSDALFSDIKYSKRMWVVESSIQEHHNKAQIKSSSIIFSNFN